MTVHNIAVIRGDGIGVEVVEQAIKVLNAACIKLDAKFEFTEFPWGSKYYLTNGNMMPEDALDILKGFHAIFLGAVGHPDIQDHITLNGLLLPIRRRFDQYACVRPSILWPGVASPLKNKKPFDIDLVVVRENTEGEYANVGGFVYQDFPAETAVQASIFTRRGCERVARYAFELCRERNKKGKVTSITKSNAQGYGMTLWDKVFNEVAERFPEIETESLLIDAACMDFIRRPEAFDVVVASNLFGDILTDLGAIITGSIGLASSANLNPERTAPSMFEPTHGSAPDIANQNIANPLAQILTGASMARHLGEEMVAARIEKAVQDLLTTGEMLPHDLGGTASTKDLGDALEASLSR